MVIEMVLGLRQSDLYVERQGKEQRRDSLGRRRQAEELHRLNAFEQGLVRRCGRRL